MGYEHEMDDWHNEQREIDIPLDVGSMMFDRKNRVSSNGVTFKKIVWNYICWVLAGKPNNWRINGK